MKKFLSQETAKFVDEKLMGPLAFSLEQLMELAGLSVAQSIAKEFSPGKVLVVCGPGNNGGDGLVAARHLFHFGFVPTVFYPKPTQNQVYLKLMMQCSALNIPILESDINYSEYSFLVDAVFGFSFKGQVREPFDSVLRNMKDSGKDIVSVDIPSGWDVEQGNVSEGIYPKMVVSLTAPKLCMENYSGTHYVGGRFVPPTLQQELEFELPTYPSSDQCVKLQ